MTMGAEVAEGPKAEAGTPGRTQKGSVIGPKERPNRVAANCKALIRKKYLGSS